VFATAGLVIPVTDPGTAPIQGVQLTAQNGPGAFSGSPLSGTMPLSGIAKICLFGPCGGPAPANVSIPLSVVGVGGTAKVTFFVNITVQGNPWTTGTAMIGTLVQAGFAHGPASGTSSTAALSGRVRLVTPIMVSTNIGSFAVVPSFGVLDLHFVPEADTFALLAAGFAMLGATGRRLQRRT
jgi:hypothetical protein